MANDTIKIVDETLRDGTQSLWGMMVSYWMMEPVMQELGEAGFDSIKLPMSFSQPIVTARFFKEDPRILYRMFADKLRGTKSDLWTAPSIGAKLDLTSAQFANKTLLKLGVKVWKDILPNWTHATVMCCTQDEIKNALPVLVPIWHEHGIEPVPCVAIGHTPRHTDEFYANAVREITEKFQPKEVQIKDVNGLLTPERIRTLIPAFQENCGDAELITHYHGMNSLSTYNTVVSMELGIRKFTTCIPPLAYGSSHPSIFNVIKNAEELGLKHNIDLEKVQSISEKLTKIGKAYGHPVDNHVLPFDLFTYKHQIPGGVISNLTTQLKQLGHEDKLQAVLEEIPVILKELGYPIMITPFSQFIVTQATLNVLSKNRWDQVLDSIIEFSYGMFGVEDAGVPYMDQNLKDKLQSLPQAKKIKERAERMFEELHSEPPLSKLKSEWNMPHASDEEFFFTYLMHGDQELKKVTPGGPDTYKKYLVEHEV